MTMNAYAATATAYREKPRVGGQEKFDALDVLTRLHEAGGNVREVVRRMGYEDDDELNKVAGRLYWFLRRLQDQGVRVDLVKRAAVGGIRKYPLTDEQIAQLVVDSDRDLEVILARCLKLAVYAEEDKADFAKWVRSRTYVMRQAGHHVPTLKRKSSPSTELSEAEVENLNRQLEKMARG